MRARVYKRRDLYCVVADVKDEREREKTDDDRAGSSADASAPTKTETGREGKEGALVAKPYHG